MSITKPDLTRVWAATAPGANVVDPDVTTPGKFDAGWQAEVPPFEHFNFLQKLFTQGIAHNNEQGINVWDTDTLYPINGLAKGSDGVTYTSIIEQSGNDPISDDGVNWATSFNNRLLNLPALTDAITYRAKLGDAVTVAERTAGKGGKATWDYVLASSVTVSPGAPSIGEVVACTTVPTLALVLRKDGIVDTRQLGSITDGSDDATAATLVAIAFAGVGGNVGFYNTTRLTAKVQPLTHQTWISIGSESSEPASFFFDATSSDSIIEFTSTTEWAVVKGIKIRSVPGFTGKAVNWNESENCQFEDSLITNIINASALRFNGGAFYNKAKNVRITSFGIGLEINGTSPNVPNNSSVEDIDIFGVGDIGLFCDSNTSMFILDKFIVEAECATAHLKVTANARLIFNNPRWEGTATPSDGYFDIVDGAEVTFNGPKFDIQKATSASFSSDLDEFRKKNLFNLIEDPLFVQDLDSGGNTPPLGWAVTAGSTSAIVKSTDTPNVALLGSSLKVTVNAATTILSYALTGGAIQALARGKKMRVHGITASVGAGSTVSILARQEGGAGGATSQTSDNLDTPKFKIHTAELDVASDATIITFQFAMFGTSGDEFFLWTPVLEVDGSYYSLAHPTQEKPWFSKGIFIGDLGNTITYASSFPVTGTHKRSDRVVNRFASVGQPKAWTCTVAGTPGTWVSEGNL